MLNKTLYDSLKDRRSYYDISNETVISDEKAIKSMPKNAFKNFSKENSLKEAHNDMFNSANHQLCISSINDFI